MKCPVCRGGTGDECDRPGYTLCAGCGSYLSDRTVTYDATYWPSRAGSMEAHRSLVTSDRLDWWLERIQTTGEILEIGCAPGALLDALVARGQTALGIDPTMPDERNVLRGEYPRANWMHRFDGIVMLDVLEHMEDPRLVLSAAYRQLRPGGTLYLQIPTLRGQTMEDRFWCAGEHTWIPTQEGLNALLASIGYKVTRLDSWHAGHEWTEARTSA